MTNGIIYDSTVYETKTSINKLNNVNTSLSLILILMNQWDAKDFSVMCDNGIKYWVPLNFVEESYALLP